MTRGILFAGKFGTLRVLTLEPFNGIDTDVSHRVGINVVTGQQVVHFGTEQALRRAQNSFGEAGMALRGHGLGSLLAGTVCRLVVTTVAKSEAIGCEIHHTAGIRGSIAGNVSAASG